MLPHAFLPLKFWDHCFTQAVYIINRASSSALSQYKVLNHALFHSHPDYSSFKVVGSLYFPHLRPYNAHKFQYKYNPCVYLGISPTTKDTNVLIQMVESTFLKMSYFMSLNFLMLT
jgi:histone deacetylase 1/2